MSLYKFLPIIMLTFDQSNNQHASGIKYKYVYKINLSSMYLIEFNIIEIVNIFYLLVLIII